MRTPRPTWLGIMLLLCLAAFLGAFVPLPGVARTVSTPAIAGDAVLGGGDTGSRGASVYVDPDYDRITGGQTSTVTIMYDGTGVAEGLRAYHLVVEYDSTLIFIDDPETDVVEGSFLSGVGTTAFFVVQADSGTVVIDCSILGVTTGATGIGDFCSITFTAKFDNSGTSPVHFAEVKLRDPDNNPISHSLTDGEIEVDNVGPDAPTVSAEPEYTQGLTNTVYWSDESGSGAVAYYAECSEEETFGTIFANSGWIALTEYEFAGLSDGQIYYYRAKAKDDLANESEWSNVEHSTQDDAKPQTSAGPLDPYYNTVVFDVPFTAWDASSGVDYVELYYQVDGGGYVKFNGSFTTSPIEFTAAGEGVYDFYTIGTDNVGNVEDPPVDPDCSTEIDLEPPPDVIDFVAEPGHNVIHLSWTLPESEQSPIEGTLIVRKSWGEGAYPEYDDWGPAAGHPTEPSDGTVVTFIPGVGGKTYDDDSFDNSTRNVYFYTAFARDEANNYSHSIPSAQDSATSYWLADVRDESGVPGSYDGLVDYYDKITLSMSYMTEDGDPGYEPEMDVGPTDDWSRLGIPLTDDWIDFEDLMILAMNYGHVNPRRAAVAVLAGAPVLGELLLSLEHISGAVQVGEEIEIAMILSGNVSEVKGIASLVSFEGDGLELLSVAAGSWPEPLAGEMFFYWGGEEEGKVRIDLALLGAGKTIGGSGTLATLRFLVTSLDVGGLDFAAGVVRDVGNETLACELRGIELVPTGLPELAEFALEQNAPNPFNPETAIAFVVPERTEVRLAVYDAGGRFVSALASGQFDPGRHSVRWDGADSRGMEVASGVYFYVLEAAGERQVKKMVLMK